MFGLLCPGNNGLIPYIIRLYAKRTRNEAGMKNTFEVADGFKFTFCRHCPLHFVGVWDTVSSVGWIWDPLKVPYTGQNPDMVNGRHAVSIDERRCYFQNNLWGDQLPGQSIKQVWFAGVHSDVGGSYSPAESGLSQIALEWMLCEAVPLGLLVDASKADQVLARVPLTTIPPPPPVPPGSGAERRPQLALLRGLVDSGIPSALLLRSGRKEGEMACSAGRKGRVIPEGSVLHETVKERNLRSIPTTNHQTYPQSS